MTANEKRNLVVSKYKILLGRNYYSQSKRDYCFKKHSDGKYYSDCSSSVSYCYKVGIVHKTDKLNLVNSDGWIPIILNNETNWVSQKYANSL